MAQLIFKNNAQSTLAGPITNVATTAALAAGTGVLFAAPAPGQYFVGTFVDAATGLVNEIVHVTNVAGDTITMVRGQEGTVAQPWNANDPFAELWTAGQAAAMLQTGDEQSGASTYAVDAGIANAYRGTYDPVITAYTPGMKLKLRIGATNTGPSTFDAGAGAAAVVRRDGSPLAGGELVTGGVPSMTWDGTRWTLDTLAPATTAAVAAGTDTQSAVTPAQFGSVSLSGIAIGGIIPWPGALAAIPPNYRNCDGTPLLRSTFAALFAALGSGAIWGPGDGVNTFNLPNLVGRALVGVDPSGTVLVGSWPVGHVGGAATHTLTVGELPPHTHPFSNPLLSTSGSVPNSQTGNTGQMYNNTDTGSTGGGSPHNNTQPSAAIYWIIRAQ